MKLISANGDHGQIVQLHVVKEPKQEAEHVNLHVITYIKSNIIFLAQHGHDGRLCQFRTDFIPVLFA